MKTAKLMPVIYILILVATGCETDENNIEEGIYTGTFTVTYSSGIETGTTTLELKNSRFICSGGANKIPAGGSGTYSIDKNKITFNDENFWTADFDWNLILNGSYDFSIDKRTLKISANKNNVGHYEYNLEKK